MARSRYWVRICIALSGSELRVIRDPVQDTVTISLSVANLTGEEQPVQIQAFSTPAGSTTIGDELGVFHTDGLPPEPAPVLMAFWDTLPAYSPALGLRRWDGAHTGPLGGRHGLFNLLRTARARQIPLALLDLKTPASLSALDYVDGLAMVLEMADQGELILPEVQPGFIPEQNEAGSNWLQLEGWDLAPLRTHNRAVAAEFGFANSPFRYSPSGLVSAPDPTSQFIFTFNPEITTTRRARWQQQVVLELPPALPPAAPTITGPDLAMRRQLIGAAIENTNRPGTGLLVLGGDLPASAWGNPEIARATFSYLDNHPWIQLLDGLDLLELPIPATPAASNLARLPNNSPDLIQDLGAAPTNRLGQAAWQAFASLFAPVFPHPASLPELREAYQGIVEVFLLAARWADAPVSIQDCKQDIDLDGQPECLLATKELLAVIQPENGSLTFAFAIGNDGPHQLIGPDYQFITGLDEPETWDIGAGFASDPGADLAAFQDPLSPDRSDGDYSLLETANGLVFSTQTGDIHKTYWIDQGKLTITLQLAQPTHYEIPLAFDPWLRFTPDWSQQYTAEPSPDGWQWGQKNGPAVAIEGTIPIQLDSILASINSIGEPEDPNQDHSAGHWLPFPLARLSIQAKDQTQLTISLVDDMGQ